MEQTRTISEIADAIAAEMKRLQYSPLTILSFICDVKHLRTYILEKTGTEFYDEELGQAYLRDRIGFPSPEKRPLTSREAAHVRCVRRIGEYQLHNALLRNHTARSKPNSGWALNDAMAITAFIESMQTADNTESTKNIRIRHIRSFYDFLDSKKLKGIHDLSPDIVSAYAMTLQGNSPVYNKHRLATLRRYFNFLYKSGIVGYDWSNAVPRVTVVSNRTVPALWKISDLEHLLKSIDRGNPAGKRNYAIILLVVQLGLRISDVSALRLESLKWNRSEIEFIQQKTQERVVLPMPDDVGWAIIDYIRYSRPKVEEPFVFLTLNAPYTRLLPGSIGTILDRQMQRCGIPKTAGTAQGMHSLRHALARRLLENGTPLPTVANIMGHTEYNSTAPYLKVDIDGLRECALSLGEEFLDA